MTRNSMFWCACFLRFSHTRCQVEASLIFEAILDIISEMLIKTGKVSMIISL